MATLDILRVVLFRPYLRGKGPAFVLTMWDTHATDKRGQTRIGYRLSDIDTMKGGRAYTSYVVFEGRDFCGSPMHADDSDASVEGLMAFLTLRPGDTDDEYFEGYTETQRAFCDAHAEALSCEVQARYCDENGNVKESE